MANKNDMSDLVRFFSALAGIVIVMTFILSFGYVVADKKYGKNIRYWKACVSSYINQQWYQAKSAK
ncbi:MAG: hypothetical protein L7H18_00930 [Candidatus Nealsonbacteria bacterium DGGOD1a]|jgi:hypothetical protein|nr:MAG: hypothetical protein L7H18_00930 [Candidatus Nealsonbacteria bacterium DGGOD1a]